MEQEKPKAPGLKWRRRQGGVEVPYWIRAGIAVNLTHFGRWLSNRFDGDVEKLKARCERLAIEARAGEGRFGPPMFDGTFDSLIDIYLRDPESPYHTLKPSSEHPYTIYADKLKQHIGELRVEDCDGRDVIRWFKIWAGVKNLKDPKARLPRARMMLTVLKTAVSFGIVSGISICRLFKAMLEELEFPAPKRRKFAPTAAQITAARAAAHANGAPRRALCYALQYETNLRQWDVIGQRLPLKDPRPAIVLPDGEKWIGLTWENLDGNLILRATPTKTEDTTEVEGTFDLRVCPMVMEELALISEADRHGPMVPDESTGAPYIYDDFKEGWKADFAAAGLPAKMWNRDLRAGGSTEGSKAGASREDRAKVAGHSVEMQAKVYDRDTVEAHRRVMAQRTAFRGRDGSGT